MTLKPVTPEAYKLLHDGLIALSQVEANGIRIDLPRLKKNRRRVQRRAKQLETELREDEVYAKWRKRFRAKTNLSSRTQLGEVLFGVMGIPVVDTTATGRPKADDEVLESLKLPFTAKYLELEKLKKIDRTFLAGIEKETVDGWLHAFFNLHTVRTMRGSSDSPNFQNFPIRDPYAGKLIRSCFIADDEDYVLVEIDFSGIEVRVAACYHKDPVMLRYIEDPTKDMHRDMAAQCYCCKAEQVTKLMRYCAKNMFVFPQFYGSFFRECALNLWNAIDNHHLEIEGVPVKEWLRKKGIKGLGDCVSRYSNGEVISFMKDRTSLGSGSGKIETTKGSFFEHIRKVEDDFWNRRFGVYSKWKKRWYSRYLEHGGFNTLTGFLLEGHFSRNDVINYPVQGSAFHCLLWSLIHIQRIMNKRRMKSKIVGQIHDSIVASVHVKELQDYIALARHIMTDRLRKHWDWIITPIDIEVEVAPAGGSWFDKKPMEV